LQCYEAAQEASLIRAIDSTFYEVTTLDQAVLDKISSSYKDVKRADAPWHP
jgi:hypothetical protein